MKSLLFIFAILFHLQVFSQDTIHINNLEIVSVNGITVGKAKSEDSSIGFHTFTGLVVDTNESGQVILEIVYSQGFQSEVREYYENGNLMCKTVYSSNDLDGEYECYDQQKRITEKGKLENGYKHGFWYKAEKGVIVELGTYDMDRKDGIWKYMNNEGKVVQEEFFINGVKIREKKYD